MNPLSAQYYLLDVFTDEKYGGNPLAIFPDARMISEHLFPKIARELNLSETVFLFPPEKSENYSMRIFTPGGELPTAGHPTVGTAYYLSREIEHPANGTLQITLNQKIGNVEVFVAFVNNIPELVTMHQPLPEFGPRHDEKKAAIADMLSLTPDELGDLPIQEVSCGNNTLIVPVRSTKELSKIAIKTDQWKQLKKETGDAFLYVFTTKGVKNGDVQGRMFAPEIGIAEDPATGSANGPLACYLTAHGIISMPAKSLQGYEMGRPSQLYLDTATDEEGKISEVKVAGKSVFMGKGYHFLEQM